MDAKNLLLIALAFFAVFFAFVIGVRIRRELAAPGGSVKPSAATLVTGFITNFFDTLGIGSYATTTAIFRKWKLVADELIPGTLTVGHTAPVIIQAYIFTTLVPVETTMLLTMIAAAVLGSWIGSGVVVKLPQRSIQLGMGLALTGAAILMALSVAKLIPGGGTDLGLTGTKLAVALVGNFVLGALMTIGIGMYAPCMIMIYLLGMNPTAAFPIMMGSCAFLMPTASYRFIKAERFDFRAVLGLAIGGLPAVLIAAYLVKSLPLDAVRVLVVIVVLYTATGLLRSARSTTFPAA